MTKKEWIQAMLDGKEVVSHDKYKTPMIWNGDTFVYKNSGIEVDLPAHTGDLRLYQEPMEVDTPLWVWFFKREFPMLVAFSHYDGDGNVVCFDNGCTSKNMDKTTTWKYWEKVCK